MSAYSTLEKKFRRMNALTEASGVLGWDMSTVMPSGGAEARMEQLAVLSGVCHEILTGPDVGDLFDEALEAKGELNGWQLANLREMQRIWRHATALEGDFVEAKIKACKRCEMVWRSARPEGNFAAVLPTLKEVLNLTQQEARIKSEIFDCNIYDALLDHYEPGGKSARIDAIFDDFSSFFPDFLQEVLEKQRSRPTPVMPDGPFPVAVQEKLGREMVQAVGFDFNHGRLDVSLHPFCGGVPDDVRITTRYDETDFMISLMGVLHETGHAMYERNLPPDWRLQPVGAARGMTMHESQSLIIEMQASRSPEFISYMASKAQAAFGSDGAAWSVENMRGIYNQVQPDFIRVDADEVTYPAHVILRYRLEKELISGNMQVEDLPQAWGDGLESLLGIRPPNDRLGCLQDIHWYDGAWGYFPTYTLGAMAAAQLFEAAKKASPEIPEALTRGDFSPLMAWLNVNVHNWGSFLSTDELLTRVTGHPLDPQIFKKHLKARYLDS
ncbi:carboxypeptidase M32 [Kiloniella laminariae]|uniref:Metal-dependent carboxypeptidase n=1 Tax=Kiloniella laminariae TaxID=454162 RepID=A0ABT4LL01_9PROT|nr:carboxypeptidase M32 [Kiloniella laminariae]MCZ4281785.1 carboxypeptidase M32 [Kiloniella laminariae]